MNAYEALADITKLYEDDKWWGTGEHALRREVRAILADVQPEPAPAGGTIDSDAALAFITRLGYGDRATYDVDAILAELSAVVRPVEGVVLTLEEATLALDRLHAGVNWSEALGLGSWSDADRALAERLEAAS